MSKFPNSSLAISAAGGTALLLGVAYGVSTNGYGEDRIATLQTSLDEARAAFTAQSAETGDLEAALGDLKAATVAQMAELREDPAFVAALASGEVEIVDRPLRAHQRRGGAYLALRPGA